MADLLNVWCRKYEYRVIHPFVGVAAESLYFPVKKQRTITPLLNIFINT
jgi:hypothetical protein